VERARHEDALVAYTQVASRAWTCDSAGPAMIRVRQKVRLATSDGRAVAVRVPRVAGLLAGRPGAPRRGVRTVDARAVAATAMVRIDCRIGTRASAVGQANLARYGALTRSVADLAGLARRPGIREAVWACAAVLLVVEGIDTLPTALDAGLATQRALACSVAQLTGSTRHTRHGGAVRTRPTVLLVIEWVGADTVTSHKPFLASQPAAPRAVAHVAWRAGRACGCALAVS
jgi:hypothetical protein